MHEAYSKSCQISKMIRHIENPSMAGAVYSGIFRDIQHYPAMLRDTEGD